VQHFSFCVIVICYIEAMESNIHVGLRLYASDVPLREATNAKRPLWGYSYIAPENLIWLLG